MNRFVFIAIVCLSAATACCRKTSEPWLIPAENFDSVIDGKRVSLYTLKAGNIVLQVTNFGARVVSIYTPDKYGEMGDIVVGADSLSKYVNPPAERFLGACVGPVANRIGNATFVIDDIAFQLPKNDNGVNTLHGGFKGLDMVVWDVLDVNDTSITLHCLHADGQEGFPGNKDITMVYSVDADNQFKIVYRATTDKDTYLNISNHPFFCLEGEGNGSVEKYIMHIKASHYIPIDSLSIPTGEVADVSGTPFDFRSAHAIGDMIDEDNEQLRNARGYDHNWCIDRATADGVELVCTVYDPDNGRQVDVLTDQPGLQFYSGNFFDGKGKGKNGNPLGFRSSIALETQHYPDSPNHADFPSILLTPGETYSHICVYRFSVHE